MEFGVPPGGPTPLRPLTVENRCCGFPRLPKPQYIFLCQQMSKDLHCCSERKYTLPLLCVCVHLCISIVLFICVFVYLCILCVFCSLPSNVKRSAILQHCNVVPREKIHSVFYIVQRIVSAIVIVFAILIVICNVVPRGKIHSSVFYIEMLPNSVFYIVQRIPQLYFHAMIYFFPLWIQRKDTYTPSFISSKEFSSPPPPPLAIPSCLFLSFLLWPQGDIALKIHTNEKTSSMLNSFHGFYKQPSDNISSSLISVFCQWKVKVFNFNQGWNARIRTQNLLHLKYFSIIITTSIKMIIAEIQVLNSNQGWNARIRMKLSQSFQARIKRIITWSYSSQSSQYLADYPAMSFLFVCKCK